MFIHSVDECLLGLHNCDVNATCMNTDESYICSCKEGFTGNGVFCSGKSALTKKVYVNSSRGSTAVTISMFYTDVDECQFEESPCNQVCINKVGSYECLCSLGFVFNPVEERCVGMLCHSYRYL